MDRSRDRQFIRCLAGLDFCIGQQRVVQKRRCLVGERVEHLVIDFAQTASSDLAVEIEHAKQPIRFGGRDVLAQRDAVDAANRVGQQHLPSLTRCRRPVCR